MTDNKYVASDMLFLNLDLIAMIEISEEESNYRYRMQIIKIYLSNGNIIYIPENERDRFSRMKVILKDLNYKYQVNNNNNNNNYTDIDD